MTEPRNRSRKVTRKAGPPETTETPVFQAPDASVEAPAKAETEKKASDEGSSNQDASSKGNRGRSNSGRAGNGTRNARSRRGDNPQNNKSNRGRRNVVKSMQGADLTERLPEPPKAPKNGLRIYALGGISEIGRNMTVFEYNNKMLLVDCGVLFPSSGEPGVDLILPDFGPIEDKLDKVEALVVTHGHEDHIGAIPWLLKLRPDLPIYASKFTLALIAAKCREHRQRPKLIEVNEKSDINRGPFNIRFWAVNHSIPDCLGLAIKTGAGLVIHTGDIKLDQTPTDGRPTDLPALSRFGDEGVDLMLCDSTNATTPGVSGSEADIAPTLKRLVGDAKQRVILASFASNVYRVQAAVDAAVASGRKVAFNGRSMIRNMEIAEKMGYLKAPRGTIVSMDDAAKMAPHKVMLITTGTQGEPMAALSRMARREHRQITVRDGDLIILSSSLVPGNEEAVFGVINMLAQIGATVVTSRDAKVHTSGHGYSGELLFLYNAARPVNAMPVHGEWRHLRANKELAISTGVERDRVVLAQNGVVVDLVDGRARVVGQIQIGNLYVDGVTMGDIDAGVLEERTSLGEGGLIAITAVIDNRTGRLLERPTVQAKGFSEDAVAMMPEVTELVENIMTDLAGEGENDPYRMVQQLRRRVSRFVEQKWRRKPMIMPTVIPTTQTQVEADEEEIRATRESL
ncbi:ribonuclease J [Corynebacterium silvaticum]|uniref:Ribonuclease J n=1 Tax=Corynebacterium silvaticum TaxID=2320431 RepID=A0A7Y4LIW0_9CORY|nr:ribonuclease J [Corynebacterium silvaticum]ARU46338.1 RNase J family beta-CASP ribonuclease [Corynebacterium silvaticum]NON69417.1 RNase J family beta-CASP ribonuclease [Corynebacterium silvaticum]UWG99562.1 RNase J family beta-CASP ribonuclease [Corynebacterium silvaticum]UWH01607.1 RNase J family beta-CASP ribonuclease [Corynebacterium silvaticum]UWH03646.1 RNase J family beta-CASP ribonuclease [Corynebacterium silvaticum]